jgi:ATP-dependent RNA helicase
VPEVLATWSDAMLHDALLRGVAACGYESPSEVQRRVIPHVLKGRNVIAHAPPGTGKTCAYALPALQLVDASRRSTQVVVVVPTWELVAQVTLTFQELGQWLSGVSTLACSGGGDPADEARRSRSSQVLVCTPGRLCMLVERGAVSPAAVRMLVVDEADAMVEKFGDELQRVLQFLSRSRYSGQLVWTSATLSDELMRVCEATMARESVVMVSPSEEQGVLPRRVKHFAMDMARCGTDDKLDVLVDIVRQHMSGDGGVGRMGGGGQMIVFCNATDRVERVVRAMDAAGIVVGVVHGKMEAADREAVTRELRSGACRVVVASDVLARGIDAQGVSAVVNFDTPHDLATYVHRCGRAGRFGREGYSLTLLQSYREQLSVVRSVEEELGVAMHEL